MEILNIVPVPHESNEIDAHRLREFAKKKPIWELADITPEYSNDLSKDAKSALVI